MELAQAVVPSIVHRFNGVCLLRVSGQNLSFFFVVIEAADRDPMSEMIHYPLYRKSHYII